MDIWKLLWKTTGIKVTFMTLFESVFMDC